MSGSLHVGYAAHNAARTSQAETIRNLAAEANVSPTHRNPLTL
jgi:hypothetical protein